MAERRRCQALDDNGVQCRREAGYEVYYHGEPGVNDKCPGWVLVRMCDQHSSSSADRRKLKDDRCAALAETPAESLTAVTAPLQARNARLREEMEDLAAHFEVMSRSDQGDAVTWSCAATTIRESLAEIEAETPAESLEAVRAAAVAELQQALESDRINVIEGVNRLTKEIESRAWLATGARSSYEWDDARYQQEFRDAKEAILEALEPLKKIGADLSNCPADAKRSLERMRAEAGRERAVRELEALAKRADNGGLGRVPVIWAGGVDQSLRAFSDYKLALDIRERLEEIAKEGK